MCGVIGLVLERDRSDLGVLAAELLRTLEYRGYDSTGAATQASDGDVVLRKGVGAPSKICGPIGIEALSGRVFAGQVRWATFGAVDETNAQPHVVDCVAPLFGAHNGNVTNCDDLQLWLRKVGHDVKSDNDGEMVVHTIEHCFANTLAEREESERMDPVVRRAAMRAAIVDAGHRLRGSYAAVVVDRVTQVLWAIKAGSSLYAGVGVDPEHGAFSIASSDLSCVLKTTHRLLPLERGEFIEMTAEQQHVYCLRTGEPRERELRRSTLVAHDVELRAPFTTFMAQEIAAQPQTVRDVVRAFNGGSERVHALRPALDAMTPDDRERVSLAIHGMRAEMDEESVGPRVAKLQNDPAFGGLRAAVATVAGGPYLSAERAMFERLRDDHPRDVVASLDAWIESEETEAFSEAVEEFISVCSRASRAGGRIYAVCCGSSFHAARIGALMFGEIAAVPLIVAVPGDFRGQYLPALNDGDVVIVVTQSGETKDVVDVLIAISDSTLDVARLALVNNMNSTIAQELAQVVIPLRCGPETAVAATKSFMNQLALFHALACALGRRTLPGRRNADARLAALEERARLLERIPGLIEQTIETTAERIESVADLLYLVPSMQILSTRLSAVALEGALKVREVVLNHTQGYEAAEFKHGPNTILGQNTLYGPREVQRFAMALGDTPPENVFTQDTGDLLDSLTTDYPLVYVCGPNDRDTALTISQINTHKIRGAISVAIAEDHSGLRQAIEKAPAGSDDYRAAYVTLPRTGDVIAAVYTATVVLQRLALRMSEKKAAFLDAAGVINHGVNPDVPKNVSKSITVD